MLASQIYKGAQSVMVSEFGSTAPPLLAFLAPDLDPINFFGPPPPPQQTSYFNSLFSSKYYITCSCAWYLFQLDPFWVSNMCCGRMFTSRNCPQTPPLTSSWRAPWWSSWTCTAPRPPSSCRRWSKRAGQGRWQLPCSQTHCPRSQTLPHIDRECALPLLTKDVHSFPHQGCIFTQHIRHIPGSSHMLPKDPAIRFHCAMEYLVPRPPWLDWLSPLPPPPPPARLAHRPGVTLRSADCWRAHFSSSSSSSTQIFLHLEYL